MRILALLLLLLSATAGAAPAESRQRIALVIGNAAYPGIGALRNPANDARDVAAKLKRLGFEVIVKTDVRQKDMLRALTEFGDKVQAGSEALFFYAGHGMQVRGRNYLIPIDAEIRTESAVSSESIDVDQLLDKLSAARLSMVILDACRNNPFERRFRGGGQGLAQINAPTGTLIAYATAPGKVAADGEGRNGLYTSELLDAMDVPGIKIEDIFKRVRTNVIRKSGQAQTPWESSSLTGDFFFIQGAPSLTETAAAAKAGKPAAPDEDALWMAIEKGNTAEDYQVYLQQYPSGKYSALALSRKQRHDLASERQRLEPDRWTTAEAENTEEGYRRYLDDYPDGRYAATATERAARLQTERLAKTEEQNRSTICFIRAFAFVNSRVTANVDLDGKRVGHLKTNEAFCIKHPPGTYLVSGYGGFPPHRRLTITTEPGRTTYVEIDHELMGWVSNLLTEEKGREEVNRLRQN